MANKTKATPRKEETRETGPEDPGCHSACDFGSDSISMKFTDGIALFSKRNQRHANQFSDFCSRPRGSDC
jgi:hypothetical protein